MDNTFNFTTFGLQLFFNLKKRVVAISLLFILFAPVATIYLYLQFEKSAIRREIKWKMIAGLDKDELVLLKFTKEEAKKKLRWEHSKEFEYNGQMYDIVSTEINGDSITYHCWWDHEETKLNKKLKKMVSMAFDQDEDKRRTQQNLHNYLFSFFCTAPPKWQLIPFQNSKIVFHNILQTTIFKPHQLTPPTPPPKLS